VNLDRVRRHEIVAEASVQVLDRAEAVGVSGAMKAPKDAGPSASASVYDSAVPMARKETVLSPGLDHQDDRDGLADVHRPLLRIERAHPTRTARSARRRN
jgi:hypothetical protein